MWVKAVFEDMTRELFFRYLQYIDKYFPDKGFLRDRLFHVIPNFHLYFNGCLSISGFFELVDRYCILLIINRLERLKCISIYRPKIKPHLYVR